jgi:hypothetical protein
VFCLELLKKIYFYTDKNNKLSKMTEAFATEVKVFGKW